MNTDDRRNQCLCVKDYHNEIERYIIETVSEIHRIVEEYIT